MINRIEIEAFDCMPFQNETVSADVLQEFLTTQCSNVFRFSSNKKVDTDSKLAEYDYNRHQWIAGRFVGEAFFKYNGIDYNIRVKPRFGESFLFKMLEEIFNIRITKSSSTQKGIKDWQLYYIKHIIAFIWIQKLADVNLHGLPKKNDKKIYQGQTIRGKLNVRKTIPLYYQSQQLASNYYEKQIDTLIAQIIYQAYQILKEDFYIANINIPDTALEALNQIQASANRKEYISETQYLNIKYKEIYLSWKPFIDLSWDIIQRKQLSQKQNNTNNGFGFFIDMAEIWEQYLRVILTKNLQIEGWTYRRVNEIAYKGFFFRRELIPDLVFQKGDMISVWDAKYKRMSGNFNDVDRSDFFQIHTYIQYYRNKFNVVAGGLLYPITSNQIDFDKYYSNYLLNKEGEKTEFCIDGIKLSEENHNDNLEINQKEFIKRIIKKLE